MVRLQQSFSLEKEIDMEALAVPAGDFVQIAIGHALVNVPNLLTKIFTKFRQRTFQALPNQCRTKLTKDAWQR
jgi:hypothetical protein